jgi:phage-related protein
LPKIAFVGVGARIVWAGSHRFLAEDYLNGLEIQAKSRAEALFKKMAAEGKIWNEEKFRHEGDGIYCFKPQGHRFPSFRDGNDYVVTHGFKKQSGKMPQNEMDRAKEARRQYKERK